MILEKGIRNRREAQKDKKASFIFFFCFFLSLMAFPQDRTFDSIFNHIATVEAFSNPDKALKRADSLFNSSSDKTKQIRSLMLQANINFHQSDLNTAKAIAQKAEKIAVDSKNYEWQIRIRGFYTNIYFKIYFVSEGLAELDRIKKLLPKIKNQQARARLYVLNNQSRAYFFQIDQQADSILYYLKQGEKHYPDMKDLSDAGYHIAISEELKGRVLFEQKKYDQSFEAYQNSLEALEPYENKTYPVYGYIYSRLGRLVFDREQDTLLAQNYLEKAQNISAVNENIELELFVAEESGRLYSRLNRPEKFSEYTYLRDSLKNKLDTERKLLAAGFYDQVKASATKKKEKLSFLYIFLFCLGAILLIVLSRRKLMIRKEPLPLVEEIRVESKPLQISKEAEKNILERLDLFEEQKNFLNPDINMSSLTTFCDSNTRYVSEVIKKHKNSDFNRYINDLRISYITEKLKKEPEFRKYKISYLAEISGFSSHSKFSAAFRKSKGTSPSVYIRDLSSGLAS